MKQKQLFLVLLLLLSAVPVFAQCTNPTCSVVIPAAFTPASITVSTFTSFRIEARLHGQNWNATTGSNEDPFNLGGFGITYLGGSGLPNRIWFKSADNGGIGAYCFINLQGANPADVLVRVQRDLGSSIGSGEAFDTITGLSLGAPCTYTISAPASNATIISQGSNIGNPVAAVLGGDIAFIRWYPSTVAIGTVPPVAVASPSTIADYEFDGNLTDTSGNTGQNFAGSVTYANTPLYSPSCSAGVQQSLRVGTTMHLDSGNSRPLDGGLTLTSVWSYFTGSDGVNQSPSISGGTTATPTVTGLNLFGSADFQVIVTDGSANSSTCNIHNGMIIAATNGIIDLTAEGIPATSQIIIGPLIRYGQNTWPWADTIHKQESDLQIANQTNYYSPYWETAEAGTISLTAGSAVITGSGTNLQLPCGGGTLPLADAAIHIIYPGTDGLTHYLNGGVVACTDATHMTFSMPKGGPYPTGTPGGVYPNCTTPCTGWHWSWGTTATGHGVNSQYGNWSFNGAPGNYYDNAKTFYALYLRSGIDTYQLAFHHMADWWWEFPIMDQGYACDPAGSSCWAPGAYRSMSTNGIYLRALEEGGGSAKWPGIWIVSQLAQSTMVNYAGFTFPVSIDGRETGYMTSILAYCALTDPNSGHRATCKANLATNLANVWTPFRRTDIGSASWLGFQYTNQVSANQATSITGQGGQGTVCVVNGSSTVTGTGTAWTTGITNFSIWFFTGTGPNIAPADNTVGDPVGYGIVSVNAGAQTMVLTSAYAGTSGCTGTSGSNKGFLVAYFQGDQSIPTPSNGFIAWGILPYSQGMLGTGFGWAAKAMDDGGFNPTAAALYRQYLHETVTWLITYGQNPISGGLYSGSLFVGCIPPIALTNVGCQSSDVSGTRTLSLDVMRAYAMDYLNNGSSTVRTNADLLMSQMFSKPGTGGPGGDGNYINQFDGFYTDPAFTPPIGQAPKWAGQLCGFEEACDNWPAVRLMGGSGGGSRVGGGVREKGIIRQ